MKRIVVYTSKTGFTKKYAEWIAEELQCEAKELKKPDVASLAQYDQVIYGGWIMGGMVSGLNELMDKGIKDLIVFSTGMTVPSDEVSDRISKQNRVEKERLFYFEGGYQPKKAGIMGRMMIRMIAGSLRKKEQKTEAEKRSLETMENGVDRTAKEAILPLITYVQNSANHVNKE